MDNEQTVQYEDQINWKKAILHNTIVFIIAFAISLILIPFLIFSLTLDASYGIELPFYHILGAMIFLCEGNILNRRILKIKRYPAKLLISCQLLLFFILAMILKMWGYYEIF